MVAPVAVLDRVSPGYGPMIHRLLGAVALVVLVWLAAAVFRLPLLPWGRGNKEVAADSEE